MLGLLIGRLFDKQNSTPSRGHRNASTRRPTVQLELEQLEGRVTPAAIRMLPGFTTNTLAANDDGSTPAVNVGFNLNFFGTVRDQVFVNNNGNITFDTDLFQFTPTALNTDNGGIPIIAPFFADVDTRGAGSGLVTYGNDTLCGRDVFGVNWIDVGYFASNVSPLNSFQLILIDRSDTGAGNFDIEFNYDQILWETGDASGGIGGLGGESARVGYSNGTGDPGTFFELPGSGVPGSFLDGGPNALVSNTLQATTPGRYHFLVRNGQVVDMQVGNEEIIDGARILFPRRYITDMNSFRQHSLLTMVNAGASASTMAGQSATDACLDIVVASAPPTSVVNGTIRNSVTVVFTNTPLVASLFPTTPPQLLPVRVANPTGFTGSGQPYITVNLINELPQDQPVLRIPVVLENPGLNQPTTPFVPDGFSFRIFAGTFDPTLL